MPLSDLHAIEEEFSERLHPYKALLSIVDYDAYVNVRILAPSGELACRLDRVSINTIADQASRHSIAEGIAYRLHRRVHG